MAQHPGNKLPNAPPALIPPHGGYQDLQSFQMAEIVHNGPVVFRDRFINPRSRTHDQMVQAAWIENHDHGGKVDK